MKTAIIKVFLAVSLIFLSSCKEYFVTTKINSNGTVERTVSYKADENDKDAQESFPETFLADKSWTSSKSRDSVNKKIIVSLSAKFNSFEDAVKEISKQRPGFDPVIDIKIDKSFKFFFTYYTYKETYRPYNKLNKTPIEKYFNRAEIEKLKAGTDSAWVKTKLESYTKYNLADMFLDTVSELLLKEHQVKMEEILTADKRKELLDELVKIDETDENNKQAIETIDRFFGKPYSGFVAGYINNNPSFEKLLESMSRYDGTYENSVIMPGIITSSNSKTIEGNRVSWKFDQEKFKFFEAEMIAESREVNVWIIVLSGAVVVTLAGLLLLPLFRKRNTI